MFLILLSLVRFVKSRIALCVSPIVNKAITFESNKLECPKIKEQNLIGWNHRPTRTGTRTTWLGLNGHGVAVWRCVSGARQEMGRLLKAMRSDSRPSSQALSPRPGGRLQLRSRALDFKGAFQLRAPVWARRSAAKLLKKISDKS